MVSAGQITDVVCVEEDLTDLPLKKKQKNKKQLMAFGLWNKCWLDGSKHIQFLS